MVLFLRTVHFLIIHQHKPKLMFDDGGLSPMHLACQRGHCAVVNEIASLVPKWIDAADSNKDKCTPMHVACEKSHKDIVSKLLEHRAKVSCTKKEFLSPLHIAVRKEFTEGVRLLLKLEERDEFINLKDKQGRTPLHYAGEHCHKTEIIELLLEGYVGNVTSVSWSSY